MKLIPNPIVFTAPSKIKNSSLAGFINEEPITAACPLPIPGRKLQIGDATAAVNNGLKKLFLFLIC